MSVGRAPVERDNPFLTRPVGRVFLSNALPMAIVMSMGGLLNLVDGIFVGRFVGVDGLAAVSAAFPVVMLLNALSVLVGGGMSSLFARHMGAGDQDEAGAIFASAHGLALLASAGLILAALLLGPWVVSALAAGDPVVARHTQSYLLIMVLGAPLQLVLGLHSDALRNEGRAGRIALLSVLVNLLNIAANYIAIVVMDLGVAGSALGTVAAQALGLGLVLGLRGRDPAALPLEVLRRNPWRGGWQSILALGMPLSLSFIGISLVASTVLLALAGSEDDYAIHAAAYGAVLRLLGLAYLPQMAIALATQSITGNNVGAGRMDRARAALRLALGCAFLLCIGVTCLGFFAGSALGALFSEDPRVIGATAAILRPVTALYAFTGPILVLAMHYQAMGSPGRAAALTLLKPWVLVPALVLSFSLAFGTENLWLAFPTADVVMLGVVLLILSRRPPVPAAPLSKAAAK